jgi:hypothetical protein
MIRTRLGFELPGLQPLRDFQFVADFSITLASRQVVARVLVS